MGAAMPPVAVQDDADMARHRLRRDLAVQPGRVKTVEQTQDR